jgi:transcriptional regulator with XRE-family HTH domain
MAITAGGEMRRVITYGERVRELREEKAWTQEHLTDIAGLQSVRTVQRVEKNETQSAETLRAIAAAFDVDVNTLRRERAIPESRLIGTWLVTHNREFLQVEEAHHWQMSYRNVLAPLDDQESQVVDHLLNDIFADRECIDRFDSDLYQSYVQSIQEPLRALFEMGLAIFIVGERRDLMLPTLGEMKPLKDHIPDWLVQHFMVVPKYGCFRLSPTEPLHSFNTSCTQAGDTLYRAAKRRNVPVHVYSNALWAAMKPNSENTVRWCDTCFPPLSGGARISFEYIEKVTGLNRWQLHSLTDAITGQPFIEGLA